MNKSVQFDKSLQDLAKFAKVLSHPARLQILKYIAENKNCITGNISSGLTLARSTGSGHLKDLKKTGVIKGDTEGKEIKCSLCSEEINRFIREFNRCFELIRKSESPE